MNYVERYVNGEFEQVWAELQSLGDSVRQEPNYSMARRVAEETMRRVRADCERIIDRLHTMNYTFGVYPDGSAGYFSVGALGSPSKASREDLSALEKAVGPLPISLVGFWEQVGSVDLVGMHPEWLKGADPLVINPPESAVSELDEMDEMMASIGHFEASLAPDNLHKDNISGGSPYAVQLPNPGVDFVFLNERHNLYFVQYLRLAILHFGGFPGLDGGGLEFQFLGSLLEGLEPF